MARRGRGRYVRRSAAQWSRLIAEQSGSGLSQRRFCEDRGLSYSTFSVWRRRVASGEGEEAAGFVEVTVEPPRREPDWDVELALGNDVVLRIRAR